MNFFVFPIGSVLLSSILPYPASAAVLQCESSQVSFLPCLISAWQRGAALAPEVHPSASPTPEIPKPPTSTLPPAYSPRLRATSLAKAATHLSPKWKNPGISERGLDPVIVTALQEEQTYLHSLNSSRTAIAMSEPPRSLPCHDAIIRAVNGKASGAIFTPQAPDNAYRIEGCLFGQTPGHLDLEPHPADPGQRIPPILLTVDDARSSWSDNKIDVHLDSRLSGIPDVPVTLVIHLSQGRRVELPGCFFIATRTDPKLLESIPASWINLQPSSVRSHSIKRLEFVSPPIEASDVPADAAGASAFVSRLDAENFGAGADTYDFTQLNPGWVVDSVQLQSYSVPCPGTSLNRQSSGHWDTHWNGRKLTVEFQDDACTSRVSPSFTFNLSVSQYALKVWVVGPVGTKPLADALFHDTNRSLTQTN